MAEGDLKDYIDVVLRRKKLIILLCVVVTSASVVISLILPKKYTATATLLPPIEEGPFTSEALRKLGNISSSFSRVISSDLYASILRSFSIRKEVVERCELKTRFEFETIEETVEELGDISKVEVRPEGVIVLSVETKDPNLSASIANTYIDVLDRFNKEVRVTRAKKNRMFIEKRLQDTEDKLHAVELSLAKFKKKHKTVALREELQKAIEAAASLKAEITAKEVELGALKESSTEEHPLVVSLEFELSKLREQLEKIEFGSSKSQISSFGAGYSVPLSKVPEIELELERLAREAELQKNIFELLTEQYELARIAEVRDTPTVELLDPAVPPRKKSSPKRMVIVVSSFFISLLAGVILGFLKEYMEGFKE